MPQQESALNGEMILTEFLGNPKVGVSLKKQIFRL